MNHHHKYSCFSLCVILYAMLSGSLVTTAWSVHGLRVEEAISDEDSSWECTGITSCGLPARGGLPNCWLGWGQQPTVTPKLLRNVRHVQDRAFVDTVMNLHVP